MSLARCGTFLYKWFGFVRRTLPEIVIRIDRFISGYMIPFTQFTFLFIQM